MRGVETTTERRLPLGLSAAARPWRRRDEAGQAIVEMALILPIVVLLMAIAFTGWDAMQQSIRLTTAARAGALKAANDLDVYIHTPHNNVTCSGGFAADGSTASNDARDAINAEEGVVNVFQNTNAANDNYVSLTSSTDIDPPSSGVTIYVVTVTISHRVGAWLPFVSTQHVSATATARYC